MWLLTAWRWLKKYWMWLLFPVGIFVFIVGRLTARRLPDVVAPEIVEAEENRRRAQEEADRQVEEAEAEREQKLDEIREEHAETVSKLTEAQKEKAAELVDDPEKLNEFLTNVGREVRQ